MTSSVPIDNEEAAELAKRLHDGPLQTLHAIRLHLRTLGKHTEHQDSALLAELSDEALRGLRDLHSVMLRLDPSLPFADPDKGYD